MGSIQLCVVITRVHGEKEHNQLLLSRMKEEAKQTATEQAERCGCRPALCRSWPEVVKPEEELASVSKQPWPRGQKTNSEEQCVPGMCLNCI